jgi:hypothetical protein
MCWKIIAIITENARNNTRKNSISMFYIYFKICGKHGVNDLHIFRLSICEFCKHREGYRLLCA